MEFDGSLRDIQAVRDLFVGLVQENLVQHLFLPTAEGHWAGSQPSCFQQFFGAGDHSSDFRAPSRDQNHEIVRRLALSETLNRQEAGGEIQAEGRSVIRKALKMSDPGGFIQEDKRSGLAIFPVGFLGMPLR